MIPAESSGLTVQVPNGRPGRGPSQYSAVDFHEAASETFDIVLAEPRVERSHRSR